MAEVYRYLRMSLVLMCVMLSLTSAVASADDEFSLNALRGLTCMTVAIDGIAGDFARYGLTATELQSQVERRLSASGIDVVGAEAAQTDNSVGQLRIKLHTVEDLYAFYSYAISLQARRKLPLADDGSSFVSQTVWSQGQSGVLNPSDLKRVYAYVDTLLDAFISAQRAHNGPARTVLNP